MSDQAEWERQLVGTDDEPGLLDLYFVSVYQDLAIWMCKRCPHIGIIARNMDGDQTNLTLGEMVQSALAHEREKHAAAKGPCGFTWTTWHDHTCNTVGNHEPHECRSCPSTTVDGSEGAL